MRHEKSSAVLELARRMAATAEGLSLDEIARDLEVSRRTAERMRDTLAELFPQMETVEAWPQKRYRIPGGLDAMFQAPTPDELAALNRAAEAAGPASAAALRSLERKVLAATRSGVRRRMAPDLEALVQAEAIAVNAGPRPVEDQAVLGPIREALIGMRALRFRYQGGSRAGAVREVTPYGLLFGRSNYLVGADTGGEQAKSWRLDLIEDAEVLDRGAAPPKDFSLQAYADQSFGVYHDAVEDVVLRFSADAARGALRWRFHSSQAVEPLPDGGVQVSFTCSGMRELAWHLFTWGPAVTVVRPEKLRRILTEELRAALAQHEKEDEAAKRPAISVQLRREI